MRTISATMDCDDLLFAGFLREDFRPERARRTGLAFRTPLSGAEVVPAGEGGDRRCGSVRRVDDPRAGIVQFVANAVLQAAGLLLVEPVLLHLLADPAELIRCHPNGRVGGD